MEGATQLVSTIGQLVGEEYRQLRGVGGQVAELRDELATMNAILRMQSDAEEGSMDHFIREWMKQVRELAYDSEDCVHLYIFRIRCRRSDGLLAWSKRMLATIFPRRRLAADIKELRARAVAISERHARYGVSREALRRSPLATALATPAPGSSSADALRPANDHDQFVGMTDQANVLAEKVQAEDGHSIKVFSIVGFGGLGKTTLAMEVCRKLEAKFQRQAQVSVSQTFDVRNDLEGLLKRVIQQILKPKADNEEGIKVEDSLTQSDIDQMKVDELVLKLKNSLKDKRYLIVIDDVWTIEAWDAIHDKLPDNECGSRIIVTTRIDIVAKACSSISNYIYHIEPLNSEDSERLFLSKAFGSLDAVCPKELEVSMSDILKKCGGLPLAIVSIACLLAHHKSSEEKNMWERVSKSIGSHMSLEGMRQIITLSYNHLPYDVRVCMMYLSIFPEDSIVNKNQLLHKWIAEGLVAEQRGLTLMEVAQAYYDELISRSMIVRGPEEISNDGNRETCRVHDMLLEVMVSKSIESNFVSLVGGQYKGMTYDKIRRLSIHGEEERTVGLLSKKKGLRNATMEMDVQHVRSLTMFDHQGHKLLDRLAELTLLRVLDLNGCKGLENRHMGDICRLYLLRYLNLCGTDISVMPPEVGELEHLQTIDVRGTNLKELPQTVKRLEKLERLFFTNKRTWNCMWMPPRGLSKMKALREVVKLGISDDIEVVKEIAELQQLQVMCVYVDSSHSTEEIRQQLALSLSKTYSLRLLNIGQTGWVGNTLEFLHHLRSPPRLLQYIRIAGGMNGMPAWIGSLTNLLEFELSWTFLVDDQLFDVLCKSPSLKSIILQLNFCKGRELVARTAHNFSALTNLQVTLADEFPKLLQFDKGAMTKLEKLSLLIGDNSNRFVGIEHLTNLKEVQLHGNREHSAMKLALKKIKAENESRHPNEFKITVRYE